MNIKWRRGTITWTITEHEHEQQHPFMSLALITQYGFLGQHNKIRYQILEIEDMAMQRI